MKDDLIPVSSLDRIQSFIDRIQQELRILRSPAGRKLRRIETELAPVGEFDRSEIDRINQAEAAMKAGSQ